MSPNAFPRAVVENWDRLCQSVTCAAIYSKNKAKGTSRLDANSPSPQSSLSERAAENDTAIPASTLHANAAIPAGIPDNTANSDAVNSATRE